MFTGLIETTGKVVKTGSILTIRPETALELSQGDSLCVDGSCLTVTTMTRDTVSFDVSPETFRRIAAPVNGRVVNLERSMKADGRFHGHFVTGHVDCTGTVTKIRRLSAFTEVTISYPGEHSDFVVSKGSIAVSGISLTIASVTKRDFVVALIPETMENTSAGGWKSGSRVNLEFDIIGKYVARAVDSARLEGSLRDYLEKY